MDELAALAWEVCPPASRLHCCKCMRKHSQASGGNVRRETACAARGQEADAGSGQQENMQTVPQADTRKNLHTVIRLATDSDRGLEERDGDGRTALHWAAANGYQVCGCPCARTHTHTHMHTHPPCCNFLRATPRRA